MTVQMGKNTLLLKFFKFKWTECVTITTDLALVVKTQYSYLQLTYYYILHKKNSQM